MSLILCKDCEEKMGDHAKMCHHCRCNNNLVFCSECGNQISCKAIQCPKCGIEIAYFNNKTNEKQKNSIIDILIIFFIN